MLMIVSAALALGLTLPSSAQDTDVSMAPPADPYKKVSELVPLPDFLPGMGQLFVDPATLPAGPFLAYDKEGALVSTIFMIPVEDFKPDKTFEDLAVPGRTVDHVDVY